MGILDKVFGPKPEKIGEVDEQEELLPPFEDDGSDIGDGDALPDRPTAFHDFEAVSREHPELRPENIEKKEEGK